MLKRCFGSQGPALDFREALTASKWVCVGTKVGVCQDVEVGVLVGEFKGLLGFPANQTFDTLSPGVTLGLMEGALLGEIKGCVVG